MACPSERPGGARGGAPDPGRPLSPHRGDYVLFGTVPTRWMDQDAYGHVNNVVYYGYFDTAVTEYLVRECGLDPSRDSPVGLVVETSCHFRKSLTFPEVLDVGLRVAHLGTSSVVYEIAIFKQHDDEAAAFGRFVHVYSDRETQRPAEIPQRHRASLVSCLPTSDALPALPLPIDR